MAATTGLSSAILGPLAPPPASTEAPAAAAATTAATSSSVKTMKQLMDEIDQVKTDFENTIKPLEKIETGRKKTLAGHDQAVQGRIKIRDFNERIVSLQNQMNAMTKETDPTYDKKLFDKTKKNGEKALTNLSHKVEQVDKHLEKATGQISTTTAPSAGTQSTAKPAVVSTVVPEAENKKGVRSLLGRLPFTRKETSLKVPPDTTTSETVPTPAKPADEPVDAAQKTTKDKAVSKEEEEEEDEEDEESGDDDDDVVSDKKKGKKKEKILIYIQIFFIYSTRKIAPNNKKN
jgi:prefoldin subunit 5